MNCKCVELKAWLHKEISQLEQIKHSVSEGSKFHGVVDAKILAYTIVLDGLQS